MRFTYYIILPGEREKADANSTYSPREVIGGYIEAPAYYLAQRKLQSRIAAGEIDSSAQLSDEVES